MFPPVRATEPRFVNAVRLNARLWLAVAGIVTLVAAATPRLWKKIERFEAGPDYRIPYSLSKDYWLYERRLERLNASNIAVVGDSVVWGEYVRADGSLAHFLSAQAEQPGKFVNAGVNGLFPLALEGLMRDYAGPLHHRKIILHCNMLWMSSPKADMHTDKEERFNHADLVPQFSPRIPCYKADLNRRLAIIVERRFSFSQWANHLQVTYFEQKNVMAWTLEETDSSPPHFTNAFRNPLAQISLAVPAEPATDPERGPGSPRHRPWSASGQGSTRFDWVELEQSLQWHAFQRVVEMLRSRGNDVLVVVGPFNEHMLAEENRAGFRRLRSGIEEWLTQHHIEHVLPATLPSELYADGSHPLTEGYQLLAKELWGNPVFRKWDERQKSEGRNPRSEANPQEKGRRGGA